MVYHKKLFSLIPIRRLRVNFGVYEFCNLSSLPSFKKKNVFKIVTGCWYLSFFCLLLVSKIKWESRSFTLAQKIKVEWHLHDVINLLWKEFCYLEERKNTSTLVTHCSFLINYMYSHEEGNLISANCKHDKANAAWLVIFGNKPGCCIAIIVSVISSCLSRKKWQDPVTLIASSSYTSCL